MNVNQRFGNLAPYLLKGYAALVMLFIIGPLAIIAFVSLTAGNYIRYPPEELSTRWYVEILNSPEWLVAIQNSIIIALGATIISITVGGSLAYALDRYDYTFSTLMSMLGIVPILLPPIVIAGAFFSFFATLGMVGDMTTIMIAHAIFFAPFPFILVLQGLEELDNIYEEAAANLGADPFTRFRTITLPLIKTNIFAGAIFVYILSLNEYIIAWILSGFVINTVPLQIYSSLRYAYSPIIAAVSVLFIIVTVVVVVAIDRLAGGIWE